MYEKRYRRSACIALISMILTGCSAQTLEKESLPELIIGGTPYSPYFYKDMDGEYAGIDVDAAVGHECALMMYEVDYPDEYRFLNMSLRSEKLGIAFKKDYEETTVDQISQVLHEMREDGTMEEIRSALFSVCCRWISKNCFILFISTRNRKKKLLFYIGKYNKISHILNIK